MDRGDVTIHRADVASYAREERSGAARLAGDALHATRDARVAPSDVAHPPTNRHWVFVKTARSPVLTMRAIDAGGHPRNGVWAPDAEAALRKQKSIMNGNRTTQAAGDQKMIDGFNRHGSLIGSLLIDGRQLK